MKKILALAALVIGMSLNSFAQDISNKQRGLTKAGEKRERVHKTPEELAKIRTERLDKELKFTDAQREKVYQLNLEQAKKQKDRQAKMEQQRKVQRDEMKSHQEKFQKILTPEQQKLVKEKFAKDGKRDTLRRKGEKFHKDAGAVKQMRKKSPTQ